MNRYQSTRTDRGAATAVSLLLAVLVLTALIVGANAAAGAVRDQIDTVKTGQAR